MQTTQFIILWLLTLFLLDQSNKRDKGSLQRNKWQKLGFWTHFFSRYFLSVLTRFMALFIAGNIHSLLFSNIFVILSGTQKTASISVVLVLFPNPWYFFSWACFCVKFLGTNYVLAFCKADIYAKLKGEQLSSFSEKMCINELMCGQFFCTDKL